MGARGQLIPSWARGWYLINLIILPYDWIFIVFRPGASGNGIGRMLFSPIYLYAEYDKAFADRNDAIVFNIYIIGFFDMMLSFFIFLCLVFEPKASKNPKLAALVITQSAELGTKTLLYLMYSWPFLQQPFRVAITLMNGAFAVVPLLLILHVTDGFQKVFTEKNAQD